MNLWGNSQVTLELRQLLENGVDPWAFDYPSFYKGEEKKAFETKVNDHFLFRQIGAETPGRFLHYFRRTVREIMPYYIQRYESVEMMKDPEIKPLDNYNMIEEYTESHQESGADSSNLSGSSERSAGITNNGTSTQADTRDGLNVRSDTPQNQINLIVGTLEGGAAVQYATEVNQEQTRESHNGTTENSTQETGEESSTQTSQGTMNREGETTHKLTRRGNIGVTTYSQLLEGYRETFLNIDMEIIDELEKCFLGVF